MDASLRPAGRSPIPAGVIGMIALLALIEAGLGRSDRYANDMAESWRVKARAARREAVGSEILCFGDSLVEFAVLPAVLEERLGVKAYNLALHAGTPSASYFLLRHALESGAKPKAVVVDFMPHQVVLNPGHEQRRIRAWPELASIGEAIDLGRTMRDGDLAGSILLGKAFASVKARPEIRTAVVSAIKGEIWSVDDALRVPVTTRNLRTNRGAYLMPTSLRPGADPAPANPDFTSLAYDPTRMVYMDRFLRLARDHGIPVYWLVLPISPEYQATAEASGADAQYGELVRRFSARFPNVVVLDGRRTPGYGPSRFIDSIHLDGKGAAALSNELADLILRPQSASATRHVALAPFRERPPAHHLEDVLESKLVFAKAWEAMQTRKR